MFAKVLENHHNDLKNRLRPPKLQVGPTVLPRKLANWHASPLHWEPASVCFTVRIILFCEVSAASSFMCQRSNDADGIPTPPKATGQAASFLWRRTYRKSVLSNTFLTFHHENGLRAVVQHVPKLITRLSEITNSIHIRNLVKTTDTKQSNIL